MKTIKLLALFLLAGFFANAQGAYIIYGGTVVDAGNNPVANQLVTVQDSSSNVFFSATRTYLTNANGFFADTIFTGSSGQLYMFTTDSCQTYQFTTPYLANGAAITWFNSFTLCTGGGSTVGGCNFSISNSPNPSGSYTFSSTYLGTATSNYTWSFGDGSAGTGPNPTHFYANPGVYTYCLQVDSCPMVCASILVSGPSSPCNAAFSTSQNGLFVEILPAMLGFAGDFVFNWGDGTIDSVNSAAMPVIPYNHTYTAAGFYSLCVEHYNDSVNCSDIVCDTLLLSTSANLICNAGFIVDTVNSQSGQVILWNTSSVTNASAGSYVTFFWDFGDGTSSNQQFPMHQYTSPGMYEVCLTITATDSSLISCTSQYCDSLGVDQNGNLIYKGAATGWTLIVLDPNSIGLEENELNNLSVFPNPVTESLTVAFPTTTSAAATCALFSIDGRQILAETLPANSISKTVNMSFLPAGIYIFSIKMNTEIRQFKIVKQ